MSTITIAEINKVLASMNSDYPRPAMEPLRMSELYDNMDPSVEWPHARNAGVYLLFNEQRELLYVGKASCNTNLGRRLRAHFDSKGLAKKEWFTEVKFVATIPVPDGRAF
jgi:hypothetical protein